MIRNKREESHTGPGSSKAVALIAVVSIGITALLYARSLRLPFYSDDLVQLPWLREITFSELWSTVSPYDYYRPLAFSVWVIWRDLGFPMTPAALRVFNLIGHALAAVLVGVLAVELSSDRENPVFGGVLAAALFAAFPFAYQVVPWVSAIFYPLVTILNVLAVLSFRRTRQSRIWWIPCLLAVGLAPFAHESGMLTGALIALTATVDWLNIPSEQRRDHRRHLLSGFAIMGAGLLALVVWLRVRSSGVSTIDLHPAGLFQNAAILSLGLSYPLAPLVTFLNSTIAVWAVLLIALACLIFLTRRIWYIALLCVGWFGIAIGPVLVTMRPDWLIDAPRFLYPAGAAAALWWGIGLTQLVKKKHGQLLATGLALIALLPGAYFAYSGVGWHLRGGEAISDAVQTAAARPDQSLLLINLPNRLAPGISVYPFFDGGAILLPARVQPGEIVGAYTGEDRLDDAAVTVGNVLPPVDYPHTIYGEQVDPGMLIDLINGGRAVYIADYVGDTVYLNYVGQRVSEHQLSGQPIAYFGDFITLWGSDLSVESGSLHLSLSWEIIHPRENAPTVFVHVVDGAGQIAAQADGDPLGGLYPFNTNPGYLILEDVRVVLLPEGGSYSVYVGVWDPAANERLPVKGGDYSDDRVPVGEVNLPGRR